VAASNPKPKQRKQVKIPPVTKLLALAHYYQRLLDTERGKRLCWNCQINRCLPGTCDPNYEPNVSGAGDSASVTVWASLRREKHWAEYPENCRTSALAEADKPLECLEINPTANKYLAHPWNHLLHSSCNQPIASCSPLFSLNQRITRVWERSVWGSGQTNSRCFRSRETNLRTESMNQWMPIIAKARTNP